MADAAPLPLSPFRQILWSGLLSLLFLLVCWLLTFTHNSVWCQRDSCHPTACNLTYSAPLADGLVRLLLRGCSRRLDQHGLLLFGCVREDNVADEDPGKTPKTEEDKVDELTDRVDR